MTIKTTITLACMALCTACYNTPNPTAQPSSAEVVRLNSIAPDRGLADPHTLIVNDTLYVMCGHDKSWQTRDYCRMDRWELWATTDLKDWNYILSIRNVDTYMGDEDNCWAGDLATKDGKYYWYFSNRNISTGVMVAPTMHGPWEDALGEALIPEKLAPTSSYDPEIWFEDGRHYIVWGAGRYFWCELGDDMLSLKGEPQHMVVQNSDGSHHGTGDKPTLFKRNEKYYLVWGFEYAMSDTFEGPYTYVGKFIDGGHGSIFQWKDQWYAIQEQHEGTAFYRGVQLNPLYFNEDGTVKLPAKNYEYPLPERRYDFRYTSQGWHCEGGGTEVKRREDGSVYIYGDVDRKGAIVASMPFLHTPLYECDRVKIKIHNESGAKLMRLALNSYDDEVGERYPRLAPQQVDWSNEEWVDVPLSGRWEEEITIPLSKFTKLDRHLHQIAIQPIADCQSGRWVIISVGVCAK